MSQTSFEFVLNEALKLPMEQQQQLIEQLSKGIRKNRLTEEQKKAAKEIVKRTRGRIKNLDRETIIWLAEDEELCGY
jgi:hypothetical protein